MDRPGNFGDPTLCSGHDETLSWLYGEGPESHATHVASCASCTAVVAEHEAVASSLGAALGAVAAAPISVARGPRVLPWVGGGLAIAAGLWLVARLVLGPSPVVADATDGVVVADTDVATHPGDAMAASSSDAFDLAIDHLDLEVATLELELL